MPPDPVELNYQPPRRKPLVPRTLVIGAWVVAALVLVLFSPLFIHTANQKWSNWQYRRAAAAAYASSYATWQTHDMKPDLVVLETSDAPAPKQPGFGVAVDSMGVAYGGVVQYRSPAWDTSLQAVFKYGGGIGWNPQGAIAFVGERQAPGAAACIIVAAIYPNGSTERLTLRLSRFALEPDGRPRSMVHAGEGHETVLEFGGKCVGYRLLAGQRTPNDPAAIDIPFTIDGNTGVISCRLLADGNFNIQATSLTIAAPAPMSPLVWKVVDTAPPSGASPSNR